MDEERARRLTRGASEEASSDVGGVVGGPAREVTSRVQRFDPESLADAGLEQLLSILIEARRRRPGPAGSDGLGHWHRTLAARSGAAPGPVPEPASGPAPHADSLLPPGDHFAAPAPGLDAGTGAQANPQPDLPFALGDHLAELAPGPELAAELVTLDPHALDIDATVEAVAAWERLMSWAAARQAELVRSLVAHEGRFGRREFAADAVATRLRVTRQAARTTVERAILLGSWPEVSHLLAAGRLDAYKAGAIVTAIADTPAELRQTVLDSVLPGAPEATAPTVRNRIRTAAQAMDPGLAQARAMAEAERRAVRLTPAPDAMAFLTFYLPAEQASTCLTAIDAMAAAARTPDDERSADARRVDALTDLLRAVLDAGRTPSGVELPTQQHRRPHIQVTVGATTLLGLDDEPAVLAGYGPIPAEMARRIAADGTWRRLLVDPTRGRVVDRDSTTYRPGVDLTATVVARDQTCTFPGCRVPAWRCDLDHIDPFREGEDPATQTTAENLHALCRHHHRLKTHTEWTVRRDPLTGLTTWTTPWGREFVDEPEPLPGATGRSSSPIQRRTLEPPVPRAARLTSGLTPRRPDQGPNQPGDLGADHGKDRRAGQGVNPGPPPF